MRIIIFLGLPGCGKGTQANLLEKNKGFLQLSTGDMLRAMSKEKSDLATELKGYMESGVLVPDDIIIKVMEQQFDLHQDKSAIILDGFPRTLKQAEFLNKMLKKTDLFELESQQAVFFSIEEQKIIDRIAGRFSCATCSENYHDKFKTPKKENVCDNCSASNFIRRKDDNEKTVKSRVSNYNKNTSPIIDFYKKQNCLIEMNADGDIDEIHQGLLKKLEK